jgi:hypothetical protein
MCKFFETLFHCGHSHDLTIIKPCTYSFDRPNQERCTLYSPAKEPVVLRDPCALCAQPWLPNKSPNHFIVSANTQQVDLPPVVVERPVLGRWYELRDFEGLDTARIYNKFGGSPAVVLERDAFESSFELVEALPGVEVEKEGRMSNGQYGQAATMVGGMGIEGEERMGTFFGAMVDRTRRQ